MAMIFRQPGETGIKSKDVNEKLTIGRYNVNIITYGVSNYD